MDTSAGAMPALASASGPATENPVSVMSGVCSAQAKLEISE